MIRTRLNCELLDVRITPAALPAGFSESLLAGGLDEPTAFALAPDGRIFVTLQAGQLRIVQNGTLLTPAAVTLPVDSSGERGLLGVTLDPNFSRNGFLYLYYTVPASGSVPAFNRVSRFALAENAAVQGSEVVLLNLDGLGSATNHNGGALHFGNDGKLYVAVGENNNPTNAQSVTNRLGKILRINPDGSIPSDNPTSFAGVAGTTEFANRAIWALGFRNPFTFAVRPTTGQLFINDVGAASFEEVNAGKAGANFGWPITEGDFDQAAFPNFTRPLYAYGRTGDPLFAGRAVAGGTFYEPTAFTFPPEFAGDYFFADFAGGWINRRDADTGQVTSFASNLAGMFPIDLAVTAQGDVLYLARGTGTAQGGVYRIRFTQGRPLVATGAGSGGGPTVATFDPTTGELLNRFFAFEGSFTGGVRVATADLTGDRTADVLAAPGPGGGPRVVVFDGITGAPTRDFFAFEPTFTGGLFVAAADFDRDGIADLIVSADVGGGPRVRILNGRTGATIADFFAFERSFTGGVRVAAGDVNGDGVPDLIVAAGTGGGPRVAVFNGKDVAAGKAEPGRLGADFFAFESTLRNGAFAAAPDLDGDGFADLTFGAGPGGAPRVISYGGRQYSTGGKIPTLVDFFAGDASARGGVTVSGADGDNDGRADLLTGPGAGSPPVATVRKGSVIVRELQAFDPAFLGGIFVS